MHHLPMRAISRKPGTPSPAATHASAPLPTPTGRAAATATPAATAAERRAEGDHVTGGLERVESEQAGGGCCCWAGQRLPAGLVALQPPDACCPCASQVLVRLRTAKTIQPPASLSHASTSRPSTCSYSPGWTTCFACTSAGRGGAAAWTSFEDASYRRLSGCILSAPEHQPFAELAWTGGCA